MYCAQQWIVLAKVAPLMARYQREEASSLFTGKDTKTETDQLVRK